MAKRLAAAKVPNNSPQYSYGITQVGDGDNGEPDAFLSNNGSLAAEQVNNDLTLISYTQPNGDLSNQAGSITFVLCANSTCSNPPM